MAADTLHGLLGEQKKHPPELSIAEGDYSKGNSSTHTVTGKDHFPPGGTRAPRKGWPILGVGQNTKISQDIFFSDQKGNY